MGRVSDERRAAQADRAYVAGGAGAASGVSRVRATPPPGNARL